MPTRQNLIHDPKYGLLNRNFHGFSSSSEWTLWRMQKNAVHKKQAIHPVPNPGQACLRFGQMEFVDVSDSTAMTSVQALTALE